MGKSFQDTLNYIKTSLPNQFIEISDAEILQRLKQHTLPEFSIYAPKYERVILNYENCIDDGFGIFEIPYNGDADEIIEIADYYSAKAPPSFSNDPISIADAILSATSKPLEPIPELDLNNPKRVIFDMPCSKVSVFLPMVLILKTIHKTPKTIPTEYYHRWWKPYALADIKLMIAESRAKFQQLSTPIGQIALNTEELKQEALQTKEQIIQELKRNWNLRTVYFV